MSTHVRRAVLWMSRVLGVLFAMFMGPTALDVLGERSGFWEPVRALPTKLDNDQLRD